MSKIIKTIKNETLLKRDAKPEDILAIEKLSKEVGFNIGLHNLKLFYDCSPKTWKVIQTETGRIVAYSILNRLPVDRELYFGYGLVVHGDYRGHGLTRFINMTYQASIGNASSDSLLRLPYKMCGEKLLSFSGAVEKHVSQIRPNTTPASNFVTNLVTRNNIDDVIVYDTKILEFNRADFLREWILAEKYPCKSTAFLAAKRDGGEVCGFGVLRQCDEFFTIAPLYAENDHVAYRLFHNLLKHLPAYREVSVMFPAKNRLVMQLVEKLDMKCTAAEMRITFVVNMKHSNLWKMNNVYCLHEFYPL